MFYQSFHCPKTNFRKGPIHHLLMTQLQEAIQDSYSNVSDPADNLLILSAIP